MLHRDGKGRLWGLTPGGWVPIVAHLRGGVPGDRLRHLSYTLSMHPSLTSVGLMQIGAADNVTTCGCATCQEASGITSKCPDATHGTGCCI